MRYAYCTLRPFASEQPLAALNHHTAGSLLVIEPSNKVALEAQVRSAAAGEFSEASVDLITTP